MAFLTPDKTYTLHGLEIKEKILPASLKPNRKLSSGTGKVEYITIHNTDDINEAAGTNDAEQYARATFNGAMGGVTVHYYIDETDCWHILNDNEVGYHAADGYYGPGNNTSLAIEIIMDGSGDSSDTGAEARGARLAAILLDKNGLGIDRLTTHNRWYPRKYCPIYILPHWSEFRKKVEKYLAEIKGTEKEEDEKSPETAGSLYRVQVGAFRVREYAESYIKTLADAGFQDAFIVEADGLFRVQVGAFRVREYAEGYITQLKKAGFDAFLVTVNDKPSGDVDGDGKVTAADAREILRASVGLGEVSADAGDIDGDGNITAADAREALNKSVGR